MHIIFYGSIDSTRSDFTRIAENLKSLVTTLARNKVNFVIRCVNAIPNNTIVPVDSLVLDALRTYNTSGKKVNLTVFHEPGDPSITSWGLPVKTYTASTMNRLQFYSELLELVDVVVGVGGQQGLLRMAISCEWAGKPILVLPGSGGTAELLWQEMFTKSYQVQSLPDSVKSKLRETPYINCENKTYGSHVMEIIHAFVDNYHRYGLKNRPFERKVVTVDSFTIHDAIKAMANMSVGLWLVLMSVIVAIISTTYSLGSIQMVSRILDILRLPSGK